MIESQSLFLLIFFFIVPDLSVLSVLWNPQEVISQNMLPYMYYCPLIVAFKWQLQQNNWRIPALKSVIICSIYEIGVISQTKRGCDLCQMADFLFCNKCVQMLTTMNDDIICWPVLCCCVFTADRNICWPISVHVRAAVTVAVVSHIVAHDIGLIYCPQYTVIASLCVILCDTGIGCVESGTPVTDMSFV